MKKISLILTFSFILGLTTYFAVREKKYSCEVVAEFGGNYRKSNNLTIPARDRVLDQIEEITSDEYIIAAIESYRLDNLYTTNAKALAGEISEQLSVERVKGTDLINLTYTSSSIEKAEQITYAIVHSHQMHNKVLYTQRIKKWLTDLTLRTTHQENIVEDHWRKLEQLKNRLGKLDSEEISSKDDDKISGIHLLEDESLFDKVKREYAEETKILEALINAKPVGDIKDFTYTTSLIIHQHNWSDETARFMEARKVNP